MNSEFVHLHLHTYYSLLDGACPIADLAQAAKSFQMPALAMTDHGNMFAAVEFYKEMSAHGIKPLLGCEVYFLKEGDRTVRDPRSVAKLTHLTLLAKDLQGYKNLCKMISAAYLDGFYYKPRVDKVLLEANSKGIIALSGCLRGAVSHAFAEDLDEEANSYAEYLAGTFGDNNFYIELMDHGLPQQEKIKPKLIELANRKGWPLVATNDVHYMQRDCAEMHDVLLCIQTGKSVHDERRMRMQSDELYFKSPEEMAELFADVPEAISNTVQIANQINIELDFKTYHFPKFSPPNNKNLEDYLVEHSKEGLEARLVQIAAQQNKQVADIRTQYEERFDFELKMIQEMGFAGYFLIVADFIEFARKQALPVGPGRGSAAGSLVAYSLGITNIDPLVHDLLFERFLNPERISMPDVDIDFCMRRRDEVIQYVAEKYGDVSQIITFGKMKARAVVRDVGRALGMSYGEVDRIAKLIPATLGMTLANALQVEPKLGKLAKENPQIKRLLEVAKNLEGFPRHASTHAAGVVISDKALTEYLPLCKGKEDEVVTQFDMKCVENIGLIKFDFLGLKTLTIIDDTLKLIKVHCDKDIDIDAIPLDDPLVYQKLSEGDTAGIFQLESQGMTALILKLKPSLFADIVALVALFRPGPLGSGMVDDFIDRKHGRTAIHYPLPQLEEILRDTYGVIVYQEQVMRIASELADFSLGDADILRRAMGKKNVDEMATQRVKFLEGAKKKQIPDAKAAFMFDLMAKFAEYGFNKSHSAAYALVSYQTAYLKCHYPTEYLAAMMTCEQENTDKILSCIADCRSHDITVLPPDVNQSEQDFTIAGEQQIRFGLGAVKNVGAGAIESIVRSRSQEGLFTSLYDFCRRIDSRRVNKRVIESLAKCGAFDFTEAPRSQLFGNIDRAMNMASSHQRDRQTGQARLFDTISNAAANVDDDSLESVPVWNEQAMLSYEKEALGFYISGHPLTQFDDLLKIYATEDTASLIEIADKKEVRLGGVNARMREITTRKGHRMAFMTLEDLHGMVEVIVFADVYSETIELLKADKPLFVVGTAESDGETVKVIAAQIFPLDEVQKHFTKSVHFFVSTTKLNQAHLAELKTLLKNFPGSSPGYVHLLEPKKVETVLSLPPELNMTASAELSLAVEKVFGEDITRYIAI